MTPVAVDAPTLIRFIPARYCDGISQYASFIYLVFSHSFFVVGLVVGLLSSCFDEIFLQFCEVCDKDLVH